MPPLPLSREDGDTGKQPLTQGISLSTVQQNPLEIDSPACLLCWQSSTRLRLRTTALPDLQILCWKFNDPFTLIPVLITANPRRIDCLTGAGDIASWVPAFDVGSTHDNAILVTYLLLNILLLACPIADDDGAV
ncbi:hypothetical protein K504DRAFT_453721 [Pleomassaria siparia CBS 279.74]|uniref:Uncharacterized protein n=1 Tax=Pleomassaria siparia CBS 279.74 TaxID=1314801 RepID=A0A6G1JQM4_9PLEO|nr:hypothetical protein K504DRAFT_453721 [Pleomassaria siparia CBS 279.74]